MSCATGNPLPIPSFLSFQLQESVEIEDKVHLQLGIEVTLHLLFQLFLAGIDLEVALHRLDITWYLRREASLSLLTSKSSLIFFAI